MLACAMVIYNSLPQNNLVKLSSKVGVVNFKDGGKDYKLHVPLRPVERRHRAFLQDGTELLSHPLVNYCVLGKDLGGVTISYLGDERLCMEEIIVD